MRYSQMQQNSGAGPAYQPIITLAQCRYLLDGGWSHLRLNVKNCERSHAKAFMRPNDPTYAERSSLRCRASTGLVLNFRLRLLRAGREFSPSWRAELGLVRMNVQILESWKLRKVGCRKLKAPLAQMVLASVPKKALALGPSKA